MEPLTLDLPILTTLASAGIVRTVLDQVKDDGYVGVKPSHGYVIQRLVDDEPTIGALAEALQMTQQGASKQVKDLEGLGYVERLPSPEDQRARRVRLTPAGRAMLESTRQAREALEARVAARVGEEALAATKQTLVALLEEVGLDERVRTRTMPTPPE